MAADDDHLRLYQEAANALRAETWYLGDADRERRHRDDWPQLWEAIDRLVALVDEDLPRVRPRTTPLFSLKELRSPAAGTGDHLFAGRQSPIA